MALEKKYLLYNRYRIEGTIASGGMGAIYRATDETLGIPVAVKENFFSTEEFSRQFRREAIILASLRHPNLPRVTDHFVISGAGQYLVMDYIEGLDLRSVITKYGLLPKDDIVRIGVTICNALDYLHSRSPAIVHRDIKPGNLKITPAGHVYLVDFGLAKISHGEATTVGAQALTPGYAPPEQYGQGTEPRSDLYSLGATLYAAFTGKVPADGLSRVMGSTDLIPIRTYNPQAPLPLVQVIEHSMLIQLDKRYQTADAFRQALMYAAPDVDLNRPIQLSEPARLPQPGQPAPVIKPELPSTVSNTTPTQSQPSSAVRAASQPNVAAQQQRNYILPGLLLMAFVAVAAIITGLVMFPGIAKNLGKAEPTAVSVAIADIPSTATVLPDILEPSATATEEPVATATLTPTVEASPTEEAAVVPATPPEPQATPLGGEPSQIAYASQRDGSTQIWLLDLNGSSTQITHLADGACQPAWSPDGKRLVFISPCSGKKEDYNLSSMYLINADGAGLVPLASLPGGDFDPAWSPDGSQIAFTTLRDNGVPHIYLYNLTDSTVMRLSSVVNYERQPAWSPDGKWLAYQSSRLGQPQIWIMTPTGENAQEFSVLVSSLEWMPVWAPDGSIMVYSQGSPSRLFARVIGNKLAKAFPLSDKASPAEGADFSPDGWWVVFESKQDGNTDLYYMLKNGSNLTKLTDNPDLDFQPAWRPPIKP